LKFTGIILAGGASSRMGSPKALLSYQGMTFADRLVHVLSPVCERVVVVLGHNAELVRRGITGGAASFAVNANPGLGQLSSLQCGLREVAETSDGVMFVPVDCPAVWQETVVRLVSAFTGDLFVVPRFSGKHGHPVLFRRQILPEFLALDPSSTAREIVHRYRDRTRYVDVDDPGVLRDVDDPAAYRELLSAASTP
jgi:molybdenum cofactor cytidylyltransferase